MKIFVFGAKVLLLFEMTKYFRNKMKKKCIFTVFMGSFEHFGFILRVISTLH